MQSWLTDADTLWVGVYIDTWTDEGYTVSASIIMEESDLPCDVALIQHTRSLLNTTKLAHDQRPFTAFPEGSLTVPFTLDALTTGATLDFLTTGHGGHAGGDEFTEQEHILLLDGDTLKAWTPWRTDCGALPPVQPDQRLLALHLRRSWRHPRRTRGILRFEPLQLVPRRCGRSPQLGPW